MKQAIDSESTELALSLLKVGASVKLGIRRGEEVHFAPGVLQIIHDKRVGVTTRLTGLQPGMSLTLFCRGSGALCAFPVTVIALSPDQRVVWFNFTGAVKRLQRRRFVRIDGLSIPTKVDTGKSMLGTGMIVDLSAGGLRLTYKGNLRVGDKLSLKFTLPAERPVIVSAEGIVRRAQEHDLGVEFTHIPQSSREAIVSWVLDYQRREGIRR
ncbi:MAG: PilZ domain-containing protein [Chloroflexota bacterium]|nr:MAG: PilZ domain-containing protein [Chloroflexota bacterium]